MSKGSKSSYDLSVINDYDFSNTRKLPLYDFEHEIEKNKELLKGN